MVDIRSKQSSPLAIHSHFMLLRIANTQKGVFKTIEKKVIQTHIRMIITVYPTSGNSGVLSKPLSPTFYLCAIDSMQSNVLGRWCSSICVTEKIDIDIFLL